MKYCGIENIEKRLELMVDDHLVADLSGGARLTMHHPCPAGVVLTHDRPWENAGSAYATVFRDGSIVRLYHRGRGTQKQDQLETTCLIESEDGVEWRRPSLGLVEFQGSRANNILHAGVGAHNFTPFLDTNPACPPEWKYKAFASSKPSPREGLYGYVSPDGVHWSHPKEDPVAIPISQGSFDSQNLAFWDTVRGEYRAYHRGYCDGVRGIKTARSADFLEWTDSEWLDFPGAGEEQIYTNSVTPYFRAPHIFVGFPTRLMSEERGCATESLFMSSRNGKTFHRWGEAFLRPGPNPNRWANRGNYIWNGLLETAASELGAPNELSLYSTEKRGTHSVLLRFTLRLDGFASLNAPLSGGEMTTHPLLFSGDRLVLNVATSAAGVVLVEIQDADGTPLPGFSRADCVEIWGDDVERTVAWRNGNGLGDIAGKPIRLQFTLRDADLFSFRFK